MKNSISSSMTHEDNNHNVSTQNSIIWIDWKKWCIKYFNATLTLNCVNQWMKNHLDIINS